MKIEKIELVERSKVVGVKCDVCGKEIYSLKNNWHSFDMHHNEWGSDSGESYRYYDVCSPGCYFIQLEKCVDVVNNDTVRYSSSAIIDGKTILFVVELLEQERLRDENN